MYGSTNEFVPTSALNTTEKRSNTQIWQPSRRIKETAQVKIKHFEKTTKSSDLIEKDSDENRVETQHEAENAAKTRVLFEQRLIDFLRDEWEPKPKIETRQRQDTAQTDIRHSDIDIQMQMQTDRTIG